MKKLALALAVTSALGASVASAAVVTEFSNGVLVPKVYFDSDNDTAVGLNTCAKGEVFWAFFDVDSDHIVDDSFPMTAYDQWNGAASSFIGDAFRGASGILGYVVFVLDTSTGGSGVTDSSGTKDWLDTSDIPCLAGAAFDIDFSENEVAFLPAVPLQAHNPNSGLSCRRTVTSSSARYCGGDFGYPDDYGRYDDDSLDDMDEDTVVRLAAGANSHDEVFLRYFVDGEEGGAESEIWIWTAQDIRANGDGGAYTVNVYNDEQDDVSLEIVFPNAELNVIVPDDLSIWPEGYTDGFILMELGESEYLSTTQTSSGAFIADGLLSWTIVSSEGFATQTIINPINLMNYDGYHEMRVREAIYDL